MLSELGTAWRAVFRRPGFSILAALTLALGIGINAALFSLLDAIYFRPLPLVEPEQLLRITATSPKAYGGLISYREYQQIAEACPAFQEVVAVGRRGVTLHHDGEVSILLIDYVSENFFEAMGIPLHLGRGFVREGTTAPEVVINDQLWRERLSGRENVVGSTIKLNDQLFTVVGVTPPGFVGLERVVRTDVWVAASQAPLVHPSLRQELEDRHLRWFEVYARLAPDASREEARVQLETLARRWEADEPQDYPESGFLVAGLDEAHRGAMRQGMIFLALPGLVLLIACANVANLLLARTEARRREMAIRAALGAGRLRLAGQLLAESFVLASFGTAFGLLMAAWTIQLFSMLVPAGEVSYTLDARFDGRMLAFSIVLLVLSTVLVSLAPASRSARADVRSAMERRAPCRRRGLGFLTQHVIVAGQMAIGVVVVITAFLMVRTLAYSANLRPGFDTRKQVATFYVVPGLAGYSAEASNRFFQECARRVETLPSVRRASFAIRLPAQGNEAGWAADFVVPGKTPPRGEDAFRIRYTMVGPGYFEVTGTRIVNGRGFTPGDGPGQPRVAIVSETMVERLFAGEDPLGRTIFMGKTDPRALEVVGVAEDIKISDLYEAPEMYVYVPYAQHPTGFGLLLVESNRSAASVMGPVRAEIARIDPKLPVLMTGSFEQHMQTVLFEERRDAWIATGLGLLALLLTGVGIYGLVSLVASSSTREIGIRMVLGATKRELLWLLWHRSLGPALAGAALGIGGALAATRFLESRLHGVVPLDGLSFLLGALVVVLVAVVASLVPASRACRLDPAITMRYE